MSLIVLSCSGDEPSNNKCLLTKTVATGDAFVTETVYTYNASGKMNTHVRTYNGATVFDYTYSYNSEGNVDKIDMVNSYMEYTYGTNKKITTAKSFLPSGEPDGTDTFLWDGDDVQITYTRPFLANPFQITELEFSNENLVRAMYKSYSGAEPNVLLNTSEILYEDFDTSLSAYYVAIVTRPGYVTETSKNNPRKKTEKVKQYSDGSVIQQSTSTTLYTYTYNAANAVITSKATTDGTTVVNTDITYDNCD